MRHQVTQDGDEIILRLSDRFTAADTQEFHRLLEELGGRQFQSLVVDLGELTHIDSTAMGLLVLLTDLAASRRFAMRVRGVGGQVKRAFQIFSFDGLFTIE